MTPSPQHDPLSEEMDLLTWQEAAARLFDETASVEQEIAELETRNDLSDGQRRSLAASRTRLDALRRVAQRVAAQRPSDQTDRTPSTGWN